MEMLKTLQENMRTLRVAMGLTQDELATYLGLTRQTVGLIELGKSELTRQIAVVFATTIRFKGNVVTNEIIKTIFNIETQDVLGIKILEATLPKEVVKR